MRFIGIDYSLSCPSVTILGKDFNTSKIFFLTDKKKFNNQFGNIIGNLHKPYNSFTERYENIANAIISFANPQKDDIIALEDYSMGSKGLIFSIAENTAILKYLLYKNQIKLELISPSSVKKYFTGKGNADKNLMYKFFLDKTNIDLFKYLNVKPTLNIGSPISDIVDSYAISLLGQSNYEKNSQI